MDGAAELSLEPAPPEPVLLYTREAVEGGRSDEGAEVHLVAGLHVGLGARDGGLDAALDLVCAGHLPDSLASTGGRLGGPDPDIVRSSSSSAGMAATLREVLPT